ncbi:MAG: exodeoxyribonuclease VII large subunit [Bacteroidales bacterium]|nr:exodeoxyribonuclease VII large subunit [Bacteroidales bacterium]
MDERKFIELNELQSQIRQGLEGAFPGLIWVKAEISAMKARRGSHCYLELSQSEEDGTLLAKVRAVVWASRYPAIESYFQEVTGGPLQEGITLLFKVRVSYSELYGLSLVVQDVDASILLGTQEEARQKTLARLKEEGRMERQKALSLPALPYRIAVISAEDAAGYRDFMRHLHENEYGFVFETTLFPALMQGALAPESMAEALRQVAAAGGPDGASAAGEAAGAGGGAAFDMVAILRGGGSKLDLLCYDDYALAAAISDCPLPVLTAVGHDQDHHICDDIAWESVKTPTALADWLLDIYKQEDECISSYVSRLSRAFAAKIARMESKIDLLETRIFAADPRNILKRGYLLAVDGGGKVLKSVASLSPGASLKLMMPDGQVDCRVEKVREK